MKLHLHLKAEYFDKIVSGDKRYEYRLYNAHWKKRIKGKRFDGIILYKGYPKLTATDRIITRPWRSYSVITITHKQFGDRLVSVFAIRVN